ncbi:MAG: pyruvate formate lyase-activating protein, partial [Candidatus Bathyarchaeia archaeon]
MAQKSLGRYFAIIKDKKLAKFKIAKAIPAEFSEKDTTEELWRKHQNLTEEFYKTEREVDAGKKKLLEKDTPEKSYLDLKIEIANRILSNCHFCTRKCSVNRLEGQLGYCKCGTEITVSSIFKHIGEEPELVPSGTIFAMGCTMRCKHCQNWTISQWIERGKIYG